MKLCEAKQDDTIDKRGTLFLLILVNFAYTHSIKQTPYHEGTVVYRVATSPCQ